MDRHSSLREGHGQTWAKAILLGEHSVVYGHPAVAVPLQDLRMRATARPTSGPSTLTSLDYSGPLTQAGPRFASVARAFEVAREFSGCLDQALEITTVSDFPHERGLGSSAAAAGAIIRAVLDACGREADADELFALTQMAEQIAHGKPSGLDAAATCSPCPIRFQGGQMRPLSQRIENASLVIADSGIHGSTREAVGGLRRRYENDPDNIGPRISCLGTLAQNAINAPARAADPEPETDKPWKANSQKKRREDSAASQGWIAHHKRMLTTWVVTAITAVVRLTDWAMKYSHVRAGRRADMGCAG